MALLITDKNIIDATLTNRGVELIYEKVKSYKPEYEHVRIERTQDGFIIQSGSGMMRSNTVGVSADRIYINNVYDKTGKSMTDDLKYFIEFELSSIIRDEKINKLL